MSNLISAEMNPEWGDQEVTRGGNEASVGVGSETEFIDKMDRNIRFDWMEAGKKPDIERHIEPGGHVRVKAQENVFNGHQRFLNLCKMLNLTPSTENKKKK